MRTLGIDLASLPERTAACSIRWGETVQVEHVHLGVDDGAILEWAEGAERVGIDAPFAWPRKFVDAVHRYQAGGALLDAPWSPDTARSLRFRRTDYFVHDLIGRWPLSVSSDLIGVPAMRCAGLLAALDVRDRSGRGRAVEAYPAAALSQWGLRSSGYKGRDNRDRLEAAVRGLARATPWLGWSGAWVATVERSDDAFDALVCALIARASLLDLTYPPSELERAMAIEEGWIAVPKAGSLTALDPAARDTSPGPA